jgi:hypothetical protein
MIYKKLYFPIIIVVVVAVAAVLVVAFRLPKKETSRSQKIFSTAPPIPTSTNSNLPPTDNVQVSYSSLFSNCQNPILPGKSGVVDWMQPQLLNNFSVFASSTGGDYIYDHSYLVGKIRTGKYQGGDLLLTDVTMGGFDTSDVFDHIVRLNGKYYFLSKYSHGEYPASSNYLKASVNLKIDTSFILEDLDLPATLHSENPKADFSYHQTKTALLNLNDVVRCSSNLTKVFNDAVAGDVYTDKPDADYTLNGFYVQAPDNTWRVYELNIPFVGKDSIPLITWNSGQKNSQTYSYQHQTTCGPEVLMDVSNVQLADLVQTGATAFNGQPIYEYKNHDSAELKTVYDRMYVPDGQSKPSYEEFSANHPVFFWQNPFGNYVRFINLKYQELVGCG